MSAKLAHQKADKHLCVALRRKVRISYTLLRHQSVGLVGYHIICHPYCKGYKCKQSLYSGKAEKINLTLSNLHNILSSKTLEI